MGLREQMAKHRCEFDAILSVATCRDSCFFGDLCWPPFDFEAETSRMSAGRDPGVILETPRRIVTVEEHSGELRYYAGGWPSHESRRYIEQDRIMAVGNELGVFASPRDAVLFAESFLVRELALQDINADRRVLHRWEPHKSRRTSRWLLGAALGLWRRVYRD